MRVRISGGRVVDPGHLDDVMDVFVADGAIVDICKPGICPRRQISRPNTHSGRNVSLRLPTCRSRKLSLPSWRLLWEIRKSGRRL